MHRSENEILIQGLGSFYRGDWEPRSAVGGYEHFESKVMRSSAAVSCSRAGLSSRERRRAPARASAAAAARASDVRGEELHDVVPRHRAGGVPVLHVHPPRHPSGAVVQHRRRVRHPLRRRRRRGGCGGGDDVDGAQAG